MTPTTLTGRPDTPGGTLVATGAERYLTFVLGTETFALPILDITEIMEYRTLTIVPMMPTFIRGVINLRGRVVPVIDMAARFARGTTDIARRTSIIIVEADHTGTDTTTHDMGIMVDAVNKVVHLSADDIEPPPAFGAGIRADFIAGMARHNGHFIIILDVSHVLSVDEMVDLSLASITGPGTAAGGPGVGAGGAGGAGAAAGVRDAGGAADAGDADPIVAAAGIDPAPEDLTF